MDAPLHPAGQAFDAIADRFDEMFDPWQSVMAQRRAVRGELLANFPVGARLLEIGGGTGTDAAWLIERGRSVFLTDASPAMVRAAKRKIGACNADVIAAEDLEILARRGLEFDGAFSNFAALNCITNLAPFGRALAKMLGPGSTAILVLFGTYSPGEVITEAVRGRFRNCFRRWRRDEVMARLSGKEFQVRYHRRREIEAALEPWFEPCGGKAIGLFVPPSAAEPWISRHPHLLAAMERADRVLADKLRALGDHVLYKFVRTESGAE